MAWPSASEIFGYWETVGLAFFTFGQILHENFRAGLLFIELCDERRVVADGDAGRQIGGGQ